MSERRIPHSPTTSAWPLPEKHRPDGKLLILSAPPPAAPSAEPDKPPLDPSISTPQSLTTQDASRLGTSTSGRPMDVHSDVQQTSREGSSLKQPENSSSDEGMLAVSAPDGRQMDVQIAAAQTAISSARTARTTKLASKAKHKKRKKTDLDERGRFRHTIRLEPKIERKLQTVAEILGVDLNAAIAVCISVHHHRLTRSGGGDE